VPSLQRCFETKPEISTALPLPKLKTCSPNYIDLAFAKTRFEDKEVAEEIKVGVDAKEGFTKMDESGNVNDGIGI